VILRRPVLEKRPLHFSFPWISDDEDAFSGERVELRVVHTGRQAAWRRNEVLRLFGTELQFRREPSQLDRLGKPRAGVTGHEIRHQVLFFS
jgi:hypothetical protein